MLARMLAPRREGAVRVSVLRVHNLASVDGASYRDTARKLADLTATVVERGKEALLAMADQEATIPEDMQELDRRLEEWRGTHRPRSPLPDELWAMAVGLAQRHNIHRVARTFGLDYGALKRRMPDSIPKPV